MARLFPAEHQLRLVGFMEAVAALRTLALPTIADAVKALAPEDYRWRAETIADVGDAYRLVDVPFPDRLRIETDFPPSFSLRLIGFMEATIALAAIDPALFGEFSLRVVLRTLKWCAPADYRERIADNERQLIAALPDRPASAEEIDEALAAAGLIRSRASRPSADIVQLGRGA